MAKAIPRTGSRRNVRIGSRKSARRIPKGVIHVQASFNNTIVTVTDVRGRVVSWSSAGTCGFKGTRRGTPFAAQTAASNAIRTVVDQGMQRAEVMIKGPGLGRDAALRAIRRSGILLTFVRDWKCVESRTDSKRLYYGRFILSPLMKGQADTIGIAMRRALLGEIEGTCITRVKSENVPHEYSTITGIQESVHEILMNLKEIVLRSNLYGTCDASICVKGPGYVTAQDIILPPYVEIVDNTQHIASLTEPIHFCIGLEIERNRGYLIKMPQNFQDGSYPIDAVFMPVRNVNHSIHSYGNGNEKQEILFLEIWTNGSLTPKEALHEASRNLIDLFIPFLHKEEENLPLEDNQRTTVVATGRRNGFWNLLTFSKKGTVNNPAGNISKGVANGSAGSPIIDGSRTAKPTLHAIVPRITTGKIYKRSLGHAGSP
ncbi:UNVERIFIED_CONTAM: DNA-directed RNA polymerase subunit alpha [Sesamum indicum]